jgi:hypothetical protein
MAPGETHVRLPLQHMNRLLGHRPLRNARCFETRKYNDARRYGGKLGGMQIAQEAGVGRTHTRYFRNLPACRSGRIVNVLRHLSTFPGQ